MDNASSALVNEASNHWHDLALLGWLSPLRFITCIASYGRRKGSAAAVQVALVVALLKVKKKILVKVSDSFIHSKIQ